MLDARELESERRLVEASQRQPRRFAKLYERYFDRVYAFAFTRTGDRTAAEDVAAETFRVALENLPRFEWRGVPFSAWLFRIASNAALHYFRQAAREETLADVVEDQGESWEARLIEVETRARLFELVKRLPRDQREVIVMRFGYEESVKEIARAMGRSEGAVKGLQHRAMESLRSWIGDWND
ncbi:MAG: sigma-70 family RNA polymerase sigma factor [Dehalococcoidia bacterium]|nr:sigma-70 family RNA polymerase sigma factor [Dehalococcoidia bacterium]